jgi:hypothetical protein
MPSLELIEELFRDTPGGASKLTDDDGGSELIQYKTYLPG